MPPLSGIGPALIAMSETLRQSLDLSLFWDFRYTIFIGLLQNLYVFLASAVLALVLALFIGLSRVSRHRVLRILSTGYAELFRNTPEFVLLIWVYYVLPILISKLLATRFSLSPFLAAVLALGVAYSGFLSETVRAGIESDPARARRSRLVTRDVAASPSCDALSFHKPCGACSPRP